MLRTVITVLALTIAVFLLLPGRSTNYSSPSQEIRHMLELGRVQEAVKTLQERIDADPKDLGSRRELVMVMAFQSPSVARPVLAEQFAGNQDLNDPNQVFADEAQNVTLGTQEIDHYWFYTLARHPDSDVRVNVATCIGDARMEGGLSTVIKLANDANKDVRVAATRSLGELGDESARFTLLCALKDGEWLVRSTAAAALGKLPRDERTTRSLFRVMRDPDEYVRLWALKSLMQQINETNRAAYRKYVDGSLGQRLAAVLSLVHVGDEGAVPDLQNLLLHITGKDRDLAARTLARKAPDACAKWVDSPVLQDQQPELCALLNDYLSRREVGEEVLAGGDPTAL